MTKILLNDNLYMLLLIVLFSMQVAMQHYSKAPMVAKTHWEEASKLGVPKSHVAIYIGSRKKTHWQSLNCTICMLNHHN